MLLTFLSFHEDVMRSGAKRLKRMQQNKKYAMNGNKENVDYVFSLCVVL